jgi:hypothetical protein
VGSVISLIHSRTNVGVDQRHSTDIWFQLNYGREGSVLSSTVAI